MKKFFLIAGIIVAAIATLVISRMPPKRQIGKNIVFHITSNYDGSRIALSSMDKSKTRTWSLYLAKEDLNLAPFNPNPEAIFDGDFTFGDSEDEFFYTGSQNGKHVLWKGFFSTKNSEKIFELNEHISYPYILKNGDIYFISRNLTTKDSSGWDWFRYSAKNGIEQISDEKYYYFRKPFLINNSILGFMNRYSFSKVGSVDDPRYRKLYIETLVLNKDPESEKILKALSEYVASSNSESEASIQCDQKGAFCIAENFIAQKGKIAFEHEFFIVNASGNKKLDTRLSWGESFTLSGDGKYLFLVGTHGARSEEYFLHKYSRNAAGDFVFVEEKDLSFIKNQSKS